MDEVSLLSSETHVFSPCQLILYLCVHKSIFLEFNHIKQNKPPYMLYKTLITATGGKLSY